MSTTTVKATGLTCNHCAMSVSEEVSEVPGVTGVNVDVVKDGVSTLTIEHEGALNTQAVADAIVEAGSPPPSSAAAGSIRSHHGLPSAVHCDGCWRGSHPCRHRKHATCATRSPAWPGR